MKKSIVFFVLATIVALTFVFMVTGCTTHAACYTLRTERSYLVGSWQHEEFNGETRVFDADGTHRIYIEDFRYHGTLFRGGLLAVLEWSIDVDILTILNEEAPKDHSDRLSIMQVIELTPTRVVLRSDMPEILGGGYADEVWVRVADRRDIPFGVDLVESNGSERGNLLTIVRSMDELKVIDLSLNRSLANLYTQEFFEQNALVIYLWTDIVTGSYFQVYRLSQKGNELIVNTYFKADYLRALNNWTVILKVSQADVQGITTVQVTKSDAICVSIFYRYAIN